MFPSRVVLFGMRLMHNLGSALSLCDVTDVDAAEHELEDAVKAVRFRTKNRCIFEELEARTPKSLLLCHSSKRLPKPRNLFGHTACAQGSEYECHKRNLMA